MKKKIRWFDYYLFPIISSWLVLSFIHGIHCVYIYDMLPLNSFILIFFFPVALMELFATVHFKRAHKDLCEKLSKRKIAFDFFGNLSFWFFCYLFWVVLLAFVKEKAPGVAFYGPKFYLFALMLWRSLFWYTTFGIAVWLALHYFISIKYRRFRLMTSVVVPVAITLFLFGYQIKYGGAGACKIDKVLQQKGVKQIVSLSDIENALSTTGPLNHRFLTPSGFLRKDPSEKIQAGYHPRGIIFDETYNSLFLFQGCTYSVQKKYLPVVIKKDMATGAISYLLSSGNIRQVHNAGDSIFFAPWKDAYIYEISKQDLTILNTIPKQTEKHKLYWEPMSVFVDDAARRLYVGNEIHPALLGYELPSGKLEGILNLQQHKLAGEGGIAYHMVKSEKNGNLYFIGAPGEQRLFEFSPSLFAITRSIKLNDVVGTALILDDVSGKLYYQSAFYDTIFVIDIETFEVVKKYSGEFHARRLRLDKRRGVLYVLGYTSGTVFPIDLDSGKTLWSVKVGGRPHGMQLTGDALWINSMLGAFKLDLNVIWEEKGYGKY